MAENLIYEQPPQMSRKEIEAEFASDDPERILKALIGAFYTESPEWVEAQCYRFADHSGASARRGVAIVLGNIGCFDGLKDLNRAVTVLGHLSEDCEPDVKTNAADSLTWVLDLAKRRGQVQ